MHKLVILIEPLPNLEEFHALWPEFLRHAESMPGLVKEAASQVEKSLFGERIYSYMHELYFNSLSDLQRALSSPAGQAAGHTLHRITRDHLVLFIAETKEEDAENLVRYRQAG
jgi:hypothetical protein